MTTLTEQRNLAIAAYKDSLDKFVGAYAQLAALDRALNAPGFGMPPAVIPFRHAHAGPDYAVDFHDQINARFAALRR